MHLFAQSLLLLLLMVSSFGCRDKTKGKSFDYLADNLRKHFVEDRRTDRFEVTHKSGFRGLYLRGYTTMPAAYDSLQATLAGGFQVAENNFRLLPDGVIGSESVGIIKVSVANLRSEPGHSQELASQALLGTPIELLDEKNGWFLVRTPDRYLAWLEAGAFSRMQPSGAAEWLAADLHVFTPAYGIATEAAENGEIITDLVAGNLVAKTGETAGAYVKVLLPDGQEGWLKTADLRPAELGQPSTFVSDTLLATARSLAGRPYLWGGTSPKGMDCSGFTKMAFYLNGFVIPRDASQQVRAGEEVLLTADFRNLLPGDQLFFGGYREDGSEKITHVGFYTGNGRFLHAGADNGRIIEQSLLPESADFAEHRLKTLLRARRLRPGTPGVVVTEEAFDDLLHK